MSVAGVQREGVVWREMRLKMEAGPEQAGPCRFRLEALLF